MPTAVIYCFCSHNGTTVSWWSAIETGGRGQETKEYISGTVENATTGIGILTAIHRSISKTDAGIDVKILAIQEKGDNMNRNRTPSLEDQIEEIMKCFDFKEVHRCMTLMNWTWAPDHRVPLIDEMKKTARSLLVHVSTLPKGSMVSTGGFTATMMRDFLILQFVVSRYDGVVT